MVVLLSDFSNHKKALPYTGEAFRIFIHRISYCNACRNVV